MTEKLIRNEQEAIEAIKSNMPTSGYYMLRESLEMAIRDMEEIQQYRALGSVEQLKNQKQNLALAYKIIGGDSNPIGTLEEIRVAVEKQKAKKPEYLGDSEDGKILCPNCQEDLWDLKECGFSVCPYCGQAIDWT